MKKIILVGLFSLSLQSALASSMLSLSGQMMNLKPAAPRHPTCRRMIIECKGENGNTAMVPVRITSLYQHHHLECRPNDEDFDAFINGDAGDLCLNNETDNPCHSKKCKYIGWGYTN